MVPTAFMASLSIKLKLIDWMGRTILVFIQLCIRSFLLRHNENDGNSVSFCRWISKNNILHNTGFRIGQDYTKSTYNENLVINNLIKRMLQ